jgi:hypothetical protein
MFSKFYSTTALIALSMYGCSLFGYTIINQTDLERTITIKETYQPDGSNDPIFMNKPRQEHIVPAKSSIDIEITPTELLFLVILTMEGGKENSQDSFQNASQVGFWLQPSDEKKTANEWGLLITEGKEESNAQNNVLDFLSNYKLETIDPKTLENF